MIIYIKNMVCPRCIESVRSIAQKCGFHPLSIALGECSVPNEEMSSERMNEFSQALNDQGFEILMDKDARIVLQIKSSLIELVYHRAEDLAHIVIPNYLQVQTNASYNTIRKVFSAVEGHSIEKYLIRIKVERVKELLRYDEKTLSEIADALGYSSVAHLSAQFKQVTGLTPSQFKSNLSSSRQSLDTL